MDALGVVPKMKILRPNLIADLAIGSWPYEMAFATETKLVLVAWTAPWAFDQKHISSMRYARGCCLVDETAGQEAIETERLGQGVRGASCDVMGKR